MKIITIGRGEDCNIILSDPVISRKHALLKIYPTGKMEIVDMGQNGTYVNGVRLAPNTPYPVTRKDVISFAHVRQLDWKAVPDNMLYIKYILAGVTVVLLLVLALSLKEKFVGEDLQEMDNVQKNEIQMTKENTDDMGKKDDNNGSTAEDGATNSDKEKNGSDLDKKNEGDGGKGLLDEVNKLDNDKSDESDGNVSEKQQNSETKQNNGNKSQNKVPSKKVNKNQEKKTENKEENKEENSNNSFIL